MVAILILGIFKFLNFIIGSYNIPYIKYKIFLPNISITNLFNFMLSNNYLCLSSADCISSVFDSLFSFNSEET